MSEKSCRVMRSARERSRGRLLMSLDQGRHDVHAVVVEEEDSCCLLC